MIRLLFFFVMLVAASSDGWVKQVPALNRKNFMQQCLYGSEKSQPLAIDILGSDLNPQTRKNIEDTLLKIRREIAIEANDLKIQQLAQQDEPTINIKHALLGMVLGSFLLQYPVISYVVKTRIAHVENGSLVAPNLPIMGIIINKFEKQPLVMRFLIDVGIINSAYIGGKLSYISLDKISDEIKELRRIDISVFLLLKALREGLEDVKLPNGERASLYTIIMLPRVFGVNDIIEDPEKYKSTLDSWGYKPLLHY